MAIKVAIANQKGGVTKTTTSLAMASWLKKEGYKVLTVDLDPQGNFSLCADCTRDGATSYDFLTGAPAERCIQHSELFGDVIAGGENMARANEKLTMMGRERKLSRALMSVERNYDIIIFDTQPDLGVLLHNALMAADAVVIPANADTFSLDGLGQLNSTIEDARLNGNPNLVVDGIAMCIYDPREKLGKECRAAFEEAADLFGTKVYKTHIRKDMTVKKAQAMRTSIFELNPKSRACEDYENLIKEILYGEEET